MIVVSLANVVSKKSESFGDNFLKRIETNFFICNITQKFRRFYSHEMK